MSVADRLSALGLLADAIASQLSAIADRQRARSLDGAKEPVVTELDLERVRDIISVRKRHVLADTPTVSDHSAAQNEHVKDAIHNAHWRVTPSRISKLPAHPRLAEHKSALSGSWLDDDEDCGNAAQPALPLMASTPQPLRRPPPVSRLYAVKGIDTVRVVQVPMAASSISTNDSFILVTPSAIYVWKGLESNTRVCFKAYSHCTRRDTIHPQECSKAMSFAVRMRSEEADRRNAQIIAVEEPRTRASTAQSSTSNEGRFWTAAGLDPKDMGVCSLSDVEFEESSKRSFRLMALSSTGSLETIASGQNMRVCRLPYRFAPN